MHPEAARARERMREAFGGTAIEFGLHAHYSARRRHTRRGAEVRRDRL